MSDRTPPPPTTRFEWRCPQPACAFRVSTRSAESLAESVEAHMAYVHQVIAQLREIVCVDAATLFCAYTETDDGGYWQTDCGHDVMWEAGGPPSTHDIRYCGRCGKPIVERPYLPAEDI